MSADGWIAVVVLAATVGAMMTNRVSVELCMAGGLLALTLAGVVDVEGALSGFSQPTIFIIGALFVVASGLGFTSRLLKVIGELLLCSCLKFLGCLGCCGSVVGKLVGLSFVDIDPVFLG